VLNPRKTLAKNIQMMRPEFIVIVIMIVLRRLFAAVQMSANTLNGAWAEKNYIMTTATTTSNVGPDVVYKINAINQ
jgi:hypothetical protein